MSKVFGRREVFFRGFDTVTTRSSTGFDAKRSATDSGAPCARRRRREIFRRSSGGNFRATATAAAVAALVTRRGGRNVRQEVVVEETSLILSDRFEIIQNR